jgi:hypothetical protein
MSSVAAAGLDETPAPSYRVAPLVGVRKARVVVGVEELLREGGLTRSGHSPGHGTGEQPESTSDSAQTISGPTVYGLGERHFLRSAPHVLY